MCVRASVSACVGVSMCAFASACMLARVRFVRTNEKNIYDQLLAGRRNKHAWCFLVRLLDPKGEIFKLQCSHVNKKRRE